MCASSHLDYVSMLLSPLPFLRVPSRRSRTDWVPRDFKQFCRSLYLYWDIVSAFPFLWTSILIDLPIFRSWSDRLGEPFFGLSLSLVYPLAFVMGESRTSPMQLVPPPSERGRSKLSLSPQLRVVLTFSLTQPGTPLRGY